MENEGLTIAIITARGGSTRIPRKNLRIVCGLPIVAWNVIQCKNSMNIDRVFLTTDDDEIAMIGEKFGAEIIRRPKYENSISANVPFLHAINYIENELKLNVKNIVPILPTSLLKKPEDLDNMISFFNEVEVLENLNTACPMKECYVYKNIVPYQNRYSNAECTKPGEKETKEGYTAKWAVTDSLWNYSKMMGGWAIGTRDFYFNAWNTSPARDIDIVTKPMDTRSVFDLYKVEEWQCVDIDYPEDLELAEVIFEHYILKGKGAQVYFDYAMKNIISNGMEQKQEPNSIAEQLKKYGGNFKIPDFTTLSGNFNIAESPDAENIPEEK
jgi:CMP-N-acetylneuraminic acid synthetase